jgi:hypothetical protein
VLPLGFNFLTKKTPADDNLMKESFQLLFQVSTSHSENFKIGLRGFAAKNVCKIGCGIISAL